MGSRFARLGWLVGVVGLASVLAARCRSRRPRLQPQDRVESILRSEFGRQRQAEESRAANQSGGSLMIAAVGLLVTVNVVELDTGDDLQLRLLAGAMLVWSIAILMRGYQLRAVAVWGVRILALATLAAVVILSLAG